MFFFKFFFLLPLLYTSTDAKTTAKAATPGSASPGGVQTGSGLGGAGASGAPDIEELVVVRQKDKYVARRYGSYAVPKTPPVLNEEVEKKEL